ncbi:MAG: DUF4376 domain-containing protein [Rhizobiaceae bacterium]|nr:DUF4376 domain-containing protein [Rhizobiaceae bacterium]
MKYAVIENGRPVAIYDQNLSHVELTEVPDHITHDHRLNSEGGWVYDPEYSSLSVQINAERDRRIATGFVFNGVLFDFDPHSKQRVTGAATLAGFAAAAGSISGDLRWANPNNDFEWISADNSLISMDAQTCFAFGKAAADHESRHIFAANALKSMSPPPEDFTNDAYWPTIGAAVI